MSVQYSSAYNRSLAIAVGIDDYGGELPPLQTAVRGAEAVAEFLDARLEFDEVVLLRNDEATRDNIYNVINRQLAHTSPDDRVLIYFAGHGITRTTTSGVQVGYLLPYGADRGEYHRAIEMGDLVDHADFMPAKHVLFLLDACFSGMAVTRAAVESDRMIEDLLKRRSVQVIAAGQEDQLVTDTWGPNGHSIFTGLLLDRLTEIDDLLTANELGLYLQRQVGMHTRSRQTPHFGHLLGSQGGDFVLHAPSAQPDVQRSQPYTQPQPTIETQPVIQPQPVKADEKQQISFKQRWWRAGIELAAALVFLLFLLISSENSPSGAVLITAFLILGLPFGAVAINHLGKRRWLRGAFHTLATGGWLIIAITMLSVEGSDSLEDTLGGIFLVILLMIPALVISVGAIIWSIVDAATRRGIE